MTITRTNRGTKRHALALLAGAALAAGGIAALAEPPTAGYAPDPPGHASAKQWVFDLRVQRGKPVVERARSVTVAKPFETARVMGRYALELYVGPELLDRIRFNIPLAGDGPPEKSDQSTKRRFHWPRFEDVTTRVRAQMADHPRAAYLAFVDRATGQVERFEWPPDADGRLVPMRRAQADAGSVDATPTAARDVGPASPPGSGPSPTSVTDAGSTGDGGPSEGEPSDAGPLDAGTKVIKPKGAKPSR